MDRLLSAQPVDDDLQSELSLRPKRLIEYIGQQKVKANLEISIAAARKRGEALDHVLLFGPPGLGKTTLANILANEMDAAIRTTSGPALERTGDLVAILTNLQQGDVLFIDEIHRLPPQVEEVLYPAMEDFQRRHHHRAGAGGAHDEVRAAEVHARRRHHARRVCSPLRCGRASASFTGSTSTTSMR